MLFESKGMYIFKKQSVVRRFVVVCFKLGIDFAQVQWNVTGDERNLSEAFLFLLMGGGLQMTHAFPELSLKCFSCSNSWMRTSGRT